MLGPLTSNYTHAHTYHARVDLRRECVLHRLFVPLGRPLGHDLGCLLPHLCGTPEIVSYRIVSWMSRAIHARYLFNKAHGP